MGQRKLRGIEGDLTFGGKGEGSRTPRESLRLCYRFDKA